MAMIICVVGGYGAAGFRYIIDFIRTVSLGEGSFVEIIRTTPLYFKIEIPLRVGLIAALFVNHFSSDDKRYGVLEVMDGVATKNGYIRMRVVLVKAAASAL